MASLPTAAHNILHSIFYIQYFTFNILHDITFITSHCHVCKGFTTNCYIQHSTFYILHFTFNILYVTINRCTQYSTFNFLYFTTNYSAHNILQSIFYMTFTFRAFHLIAELSLCSDHWLSSSSIFPCPRWPYRQNIFWNLLSHPLFFCPQNNLSVTNRPNLFDLSTKTCLTFQQKLVWPFNEKLNAT